MPDTQAPAEIGPALNLSLLFADDRKPVDLRGKLPLLYFRLAPHYYGPESEVTLIFLIDGDDLDGKIRNAQPPGRATDAVFYWGDDAKAELLRNMWQCLLLDKGNFPLNNETLLADVEGILKKFEGPNNDDQAPAVSVKKFSDSNWSTVSVPKINGNYHIAIELNRIANQCANKYVAVRFVTRRPPTVHYLDRTGAFDSTVTLLHWVNADVEVTHFVFQFDYPRLHMLPQWMFKVLESTGLHVLAEHVVHNVPLPYGNKPEELRSEDGINCWQKLNKGEQFNFLIVYRQLAFNFREFLHLVLLALYLIIAVRYFSEIDWRIWTLPFPAWALIGCTPVALYMVLRLLGWLPKWIMPRRYTANE